MIPTINYCEENINSLIVQPANSWSNLIYIFIAVYLFVISRKQKSFLLKSFFVFPLLIGVFSFVYHASYSFTAQILDLISMFLFGSFLIVLNLKRFQSKLFTRDRLIFIYILINLICAALVGFLRTVFGFNIGIPIFVVIIITILLTEITLRKRNQDRYKLKNLTIAIVILLIAQIFWLLDYLRIWCDAGSFHLVNGHAVWHIVNSFSVVFVYLFYKQFECLKNNNFNKD